MIEVAIFKQIALSFPEATEEPHFEKTSFRVKKKIFASYDAENHWACVKLSLLNQDLFSAYNKEIIFPVPNKWGKKGYTYLDLKRVPKEMLVDALINSYCLVAPKKLAIMVENEDFTRNE